MASVPGQEKNIIEIATDRLNVYANPIEIRALGQIVSDDPRVRELIVKSLHHPSESVRIAAVGAASPRLEYDLDLQLLLREMLEDESLYLRLEACEVLAPFIKDEKLRSQLLPVLTSDTEELVMAGGHDAREALIKHWGALAGQDANARDQAIDMLNSRDSQLRLSGAEILREAGPQVLRQVIPQLLSAMDRTDGFDSFPARIAAAEVLINYGKYSRRALEVLISALNYGTHPLVLVPMADDVRTSAASALGKLKAEDYQPEAIQRLIERLQTESEASVLDSLFAAMLSLISAHHFEH